jgi:hypothetical protein
LSLEGFRHKRFKAGRALHQLITKHPELETLLVPPAWRWRVRCGLGLAATTMTGAFEKHVPFRALLFPILGEACWFHMEYYFWAGYKEAGHADLKAHP